MEFWISQWIRKNGLRLESFLSCFFALDYMFALLSLSLSLVPYFSMQTTLVQDLPPVIIFFIFTVTFALTSCCQSPQTCQP